MGQELATKNDLRSLIASDKFKDQVALALPAHCTPDRFARIALSALNRTPKLADCSQSSVLKCLMDLSAFGLEPDGRNAHLIPYGNECQLIIDWKGLVALAKRNGDVTAWQAFDVCENDLFTWENGEVKHSIDYRKDRGKPQCYYSKVTLKDGGASYEVMTLAEVEAIRARSKSKNNGPWVTDFGEMAKKTVVRRHSKQLDLSPQVQDAVATDTGDFEDQRQMRVVKAAVVPSVLPLPAKADKEPPPSDARTATPAEMVRAKMDADSVAWSQIQQWLSDNGEESAETPEKTNERVLEAVLANW